MLRQKKRPVRSQRKEAQKDQLHCWRSLHNWVVYLKIIIRENTFSVNQEDWDRNTPSNSPKAPGTKKKKTRERKGPSRGIIQKCAPHQRSPCAPKFGERSHEETLHQEGCARRAAWDLAQNICKLKKPDKGTFFPPIETKMMLAPTSKNPEERELAVYSGASMHMMKKKDLGSDDLDTLRRSRNPTVVLSANREVHTNEEAQVFANDFKSLRDCAMTRRNASSSIAWKTLRRSRIVLWVRQRSKTSERTHSCLPRKQHFQFLPESRSEINRDQQCERCWSFSSRETGMAEQVRSKVQRKLWIEM